MFLQQLFFKDCNLRLGKCFHTVIHTIKKTTQFTLRVKKSAVKICRFHCGKIFMCTLHKGLFFFN